MCVVDNWSFGLG